MSEKELFSASLFKTGLPLQALPYETELCNKPLPGSSGKGFFYFVHL
ncbi:MAG: hypothetical protein HKK66_11450 [Chlorobiaceae bacterium]|nr:hypothetical protein [Chlorobiaceae bacterium]